MLFMLNSYASMKKAMNWIESFNGNYFVFVLFVFYSKKKCSDGTFTRSYTGSLRSAPIFCHAISKSHHLRFLRVISHGQLLYWCKTREKKWGRTNRLGKSDKGLKPLNWFRSVEDIDWIVFVFTDFNRQSSFSTRVAQGFQSCKP